MTIRGEMYCNACYLHIGLQKHAVVPAPAGDLHFHDREPGDCWGKQRELRARYCQPGKQGDRTNPGNNQFVQPKAA